MFAKTARSGCASSRFCIFNLVVRRCEVEGTECALTDLHADFCSFACTAKFTGVHHLLLSPLSRGSLLSPSLSHSSLLTAAVPPPSPTHTRSSSITHPRGNDSMKQTRTNLASASALWLCDVTGKKLFKCARLRACV